MAVQVSEKCFCPRLLQVVVKKIASQRVPTLLPSLGGASEVSALGLSGDGGGTGAGASAFVGTYVAATKTVYLVSIWCSYRESISREHLLAHMMQLQQQHVTPASVGTYVSATETFYLIIVSLHICCSHRNSI